MLGGEPAWQRTMPEADGSAVKASDRACFARARSPPLCIEYQEPCSRVLAYRARTTAASLAVRLDIS
jgi:hypothetical protein